MYQDIQRANKSLAAASMTPDDAAKHLLFANPDFADYTPNWGSKAGRSLRSKPK